MNLNRLLKYVQKIKKYIRESIFEKKIDKQNLYYQTKYQRDMTKDEKKEYAFRIFVAYTFPIIILCLLFLYSMF